MQLARMYIPKTLQKSIFDRLFFSQMTLQKIRNRMSSFRSMSILCCVLMTCVVSPYSDAAIQRESLWLGFSNQQHFSKNKKWVYMQHGQLRMSNLSHPVKTILVENNVGYILDPTKHVWLGHYFANNNIHYKENIENRLLQQFSWKLQDNQHGRVLSRTRLEEFAFTDRKQNLVEVRQLWAYEYRRFFYGHINPLVYEELFFHLNNPKYASTHFLSQNRLFFGANVYQSKHAFWRLGYMNQYLSGNQSRKPEMNHVLMMTYVFGDIGINLPFDS